MLSIRILLLSLAALLVADFPIAAQTAARGGSKLPSESSLNRFGLTRRWWGHATVNFNRDKLVFLTVDEEYLFLQSSAGVVTAFDCETGRQLWARTLGSRDRPTFRASLNDELLFVVNGMKLYAARKKTGDIVWELNLPAQASSSPVADDERVFVGFLDGSMYAFDLEKIQDRYSAGLLPQYSAETVLWRYRTNRPITIPAVPGGKLVAFASQNGSLYSLAADTHRMVFQFETDAKLSAPMVRYENNLLLASEDSNFYSLNLLNGKPAWQFTTGVVIRKAPVLIEDEVYLIPERHNLYKLSAEKGVAEWKQPEIDTFLSAS
ncbi:MAG: PQQ-binding-like beta-propeller repeat protein, partial [Planctomycetales bacterium]